MKNCNIIKNRNKDGNQTEKINKVIANNGKASKLFETISKIKNNNVDSLSVYDNTLSEDFITNIRPGLKLDSNNEPMIMYASPSYDGLYSLSYSMNVNSIPVYVNAKTFVDSNSISGSNLLQIDNLQNFKSDLNTNTEIKEGVDELFNENPELASIGSKEQYSEYLNTIFPDSKVKDIVYHGYKLKKDNYGRDDLNIEKFDKSKAPKGFYFTTDKTYANTFTERYTNVKESGLIQAIVNLKNPKQQKDLFKTDPAIATNENKDGFVGNDMGFEKDNVVVVFEPEQIHILGNKQDMEGFKEFVNNKYQQDFTPSQNNLQQGFEWLKSVLPNANTKLVQGLIDGLGRGAYNTAKDLIMASEQFADKGTIKHEAVHRVLALLPETEREAILNEASKRFNIPRGKSTVNVKYSQAQQNEVNYMLKAVDILQSDKAKQIFKTLEKNKVTNDVFWKNIQELGIPKEQINLLKEYNTTNRENLITNIISDYSYVINVDISKDIYKKNNRGYKYFIFNGVKYINTSYGYGSEDVDGNITPINHIAFQKIQDDYLASNPSVLYNREVFGPKGDDLLVGSNSDAVSNINGNSVKYRYDNSINWEYLEKEINTPAIKINTSIKNHAGFFNRDVRIGHFRAMYNNQNGIAEIQVMQSDLFQKIKDDMFVTDNENNIKDIKNYLLKINDDLGGFSKTGIKGSDIQYANNAVLRLKKYNKILNLLQKNEYTEVKYKSNPMYITFIVDGEKIISDSINVKKDETISDYYEEIAHRASYFTKDNNKQLNNDKELLNNIKQKLKVDLYNNNSDRVESNEEKFLQLLNKNDKWVSFFTKSIIQDSAKNGINKVRFPKGDAATSGQFKYDEKEGLEKNKKSVYNFYQNTITDNLIKQFGKENVIEYIDEYGMSWNEIDLSSSKVKEQTNVIKFQSPTLEYTGDLAIEEKLAEMAETSKDEMVAVTPMQKFIQNLKNFFRNLFKERDTITRLLRNMNQGAYAKLSKNTLTLSKIPTARITKTQYDSYPKKIQDLYSENFLGIYESSMTSKEIQSKMLELLKDDYDVLVIKNNYINKEYNLASLRDVNDSTESIIIKDESLPELDITNTKCK